ncbi:GCN5-related N-acetyltransferase [Desulfobulbus propionicus DSM 2032]|jgi:GNAT superfamily N-acetyltransferase|uniref:GCN5-related N-acetyltransferase n=1 Tax=Desulfobulbus propionicus (strain ATCC 33891 / DSM 2032 / VKM B-1956 / 1pr3) TaxID=577650 RepID=A0A7U4DP22_DESPD|nr:GNAT family N-acetyltransferase [Desulfobulbus propionicus]ADW17604.1 GCN5-related N-acetyltransferase [Desulfobulbus propionicus DSM 2032]
MELDIRLNCLDVDWATVAATLKSVGMAHFPPEVHKKSFEASHATVFVRNKGRLVGFGRAISDGIRQAAVYDVAVVPEYQGQGIGTVILRTILGNVPNCNVILYASPGKEDFYRTLGFRRMQTGMALFTNPELMAEKGFTE